ncbi:hypothetical protein LMXM_34_4730 [Leishmania mexicana MHOM/GT/2001/U1103]|uniref:Uncharacterized protein n=1 Tax=Leishmania mexicana (strain MHOM/GT/2001/U1103) TaxID=929439 RepID=E9B702_LEIMU|nr:hypothetical protein LMXM_34_4730 [Leishmania mexicana MHOM/GT/2001/U1103]CBZ31025.1 hypothetical protein LMXM_34_4730 [Leishmania mexicana MHOM/GT/2001/U1103]
MALEVPRPLRLSESDQLLAWEGDLESRWSQLQQRRRSAEELRARQIQLEASLLELNNENVAAQYVLEERRRALATRRTQLRESAAALKQRTVEVAKASRRRQESMAEETVAVDAAWRELEQRTRLEEASHVQQMRALDARKQRAQGCDADTQKRLSALREREMQLVAQQEVLGYHRQSSMDFLRQSLEQLQREAEGHKKLLIALDGIKEP